MKDSNPKLHSNFDDYTKSRNQRLVESGKPKMVAMVAAANKLLRQAFGVLKSGIPFDEEYLQKAKTMA